jgi:hypothetical protein
MVRALSTALASTPAAAPVMTTCSMPVVSSRRTRLPEAAEIWMVSVPLVPKSLIDSSMP